MKYVVSVAKAYKHRGKHRHYRAKKHWFVYFYEYDEFEEKWHMRSQQVNCILALYYMIQKRHRLKMICPDCGSVFLGLVKSFREKVECPHCGDFIN